MLSSLSFFSLASLASSSLLRITGPEEGVGTFLTLVLEEAREILETLDFESSAPLSLRWFGCLEEAATEPGLGGLTYCCCF